jgi:hypothetical protein
MNVVNRTGNFPQTSLYLLPEGSLGKNTGFIHYVHSPQTFPRML